MITAAEERKSKVTAAIISLGITALIFLFFILYQIVTPNPPFEFAGVSGMEVNFGTFNEGTGTVENNGIGEASSVTSQAANQKSADSKSEEVFTSETGEVVDLKKDTKTKKENKEVTTPNKNNVEVVKQKEDKSASNLLSAYKNNTGKNSGGDGTSGKNGNEGDPNGNPNTDEKGGKGNDPNHDRDGKGGPGGFSLSGRKIVTLPCKVNDSKEEGIVVVTIKVDRQGNVTEADPNGRGTSTSSSVLKSKARQAALCAKFDPTDKSDEQQGTMTFKFEF